MPTGLVSDPMFLQHDTGRGHPETAARLSVAADALKARPWFKALRQYAPRAVEPRWLEAVHAPDYAARVAEECARGAECIDSPDVQVSTESHHVALHATGGLLQLCDALMQGEIDNGFALVRPPGHHAEQALAMGFCLYNSVAVAARYLQQAHGLERVCILDWDVHHGNGTQHLFEEDPSVLFVSLHQYPHYPGTGARSETGRGAGEGATLNCPMSAGSTDADYRAAFEEAVLPKIEQFGADALLVSAGFDAHRADPLSSINLDTDSYRWMSEAVAELAAKHCGGRLLSVLEGGYDLPALAESVATHVEVLSKH